MTVLCRSSTTLEVPAAPLCRPSRAPFPLTQQSRCVSARSRGPGCRAAGVAIAYKLLDAAQARWRRLNGHGLVALVRAGTEFIDGKLQERDNHERELEEVLELQHVRHYRTRPWRAAGQSGSSTESKVGQVVLLRDSPRHHAVSKAIKPSSPLVGRDTVAPPTADHDRDDDIVQLALAILDEELRSWVKTRHRGRASEAEGVSEPNEQSGEAS